LASIGLYWSLSASIGSPQQQRLRAAVIWSKQVSFQASQSMNAIGDRKVLWRNVHERAQFARPDIFD
jgi:hypothetical protein